MNSPLMSSSRFASHNARAVPRHSAAATPVHLLAVRCPLAPLLPCIHAVDKTEVLQDSALTFRREAHRAKRVLWWRVSSATLLGLAAG